MTGIAIGVSFAAGVAIGAEVIPIAVLLCATLYFTGKVRLLWCAVVCTAGLAGVVRAVPAPSPESPSWVDEATALRGRVVSGPLTTGFGQRFELAVVEIRTAGGWVRADAVVCISAAVPPELRWGDRVFLVATGERLDDLPPGLGDALAARGCAASYTAWQTTLVEDGNGWRHRLDGVRRQMASQLQADAPGDAGALMAGLVTGDDGALSDDVRTAFVSTGTTHITAISGGNLALVVVSLTAARAWIGYGRRIFWQAATAFGVWGYALVVGLEAPVMRAALVATGAVFAASFGRRADLVTLTAIAAALQLAARPEDFWSLSFRLSFASALALTLALQGTDVHGAFGAVRGALLGVVAAQVAATPILITTFGTVSPLSLPANFVIAPFVAFAFPLAALAGLLSVVSNDLASAVSAPASLCAKAVIRIVEGFDRIRGSQVPVGIDGLYVALVLPLVSVAIVAFLSADGRQALRRAWRGASRQTGTAWALMAVGGAAFVVGFGIEALR